MPQDTGLDWLDKVGKRIRKAFEPKPEEKPVSEETQKAIDKAIGPRFIDTTKRDKPVPEKIVPVKEPIKRPKKAVKKGPSKY